MTSVLVERDGPIGRLVMNRPDAGNSIDPGFADAFAVGTQELIADPGIRVLVISARGRFFCAGGDVKAIAAHEGDRADFVSSLARRMSAGISALFSTPKPIISEINGPVAGAGNAIVMVSDVAISGTHASYRSAYLGVGLTPDCGVSYLLPRLVSSRRARQFLLLNRVLSADEALSWDLVDEVVSDSSLTDRVEHVAARFAGHEHGALLGTKSLLARRSVEEFNTHLEHEAALIGIMSSSVESEHLIDGFAGKP